MTISATSNLIAEQCWATPVAQPHSDAPDESEIYHNILMVHLPKSFTLTQFTLTQNYTFLENIFLNFHFRTAVQLTHRLSSMQMVKTIKFDSKSKCLDLRDKTREMFGFTVLFVSVAINAKK